MLTVQDAQTRQALGGLILACAALYPDAVILDVDAFYCANIDEFPRQAESARNAEVLLLPPGELEVASLPPILLARRKLVVIDDLNSLSSLAVDGVRSHQLEALMSILSYNTRINNSWLIATTFRTEAGSKRTKARRSLSELGDVLVEAQLGEGLLKLKTGQASGWPGNELEV